MSRRVFESSEVFFSGELSDDNLVKAPEISQILRGIVKSQHTVTLRKENQQFMDALEEFLECKAKMDEACQGLVDSALANSNLEVEDLEGSAQHPQQAVSGQPVQGLSDLYAAAQQAQPIFFTRIQETVQTFRQSVGAEEQEIVVSEDKLKDTIRAMEKAKEDYADRPAPASWLYDIVRASIVFASSQQLLQFVETLLQDFTILQSKNRFQRPSFTGYRDWCLHLQIDTGLGFQHVCELQLHYQPILQLSKELGTYAHYQQFRFYFANADFEIENRVSDLNAIQGYQFHTREWKQKNIVDLDRLRRLASLFHHRLGEHLIAAKLECEILLAAKVCDVAYSYETLGSLLMKMTEDGETLYEEATLMHEQALQIRLNTFGKMHKSVASSYFQLGLLLEKQEKYYSALSMHNKALCIRLEAFGKNDPLVVASYNQIGMIWESLSGFDEAKSHYEKALEIRMDTLGEKDVLVATSHSNIGSVLEHQGKYKDALETHKKALQIRRETFGDRHRSVPYSLNKMGGVLKELQKFEEAKALHEEALQIQLDIHGEKPNPAVASTYNNLGAVFLRQGDYEQAKNMHQKALEIRLETLGQNHLSVANSYSTLGVILVKQRHYEEGKTMHEDALKIRLEALGERHVSVASSYHCLGVVLEKQMEYKEAELLHRRALEIRTEILGPNHLTVNTSKKRLQQVLEKQAEEDEFSSSESSSSSMIRSTMTACFRSVLKKKQPPKPPM